jgi:hypothetical protein
MRLLARRGELLAHLGRGGALGGEPAFGLLACRLHLRPGAGQRLVAGGELRAEPLLLGLGGGERGADLLDLLAHRLELVVALGDRGLRLVA